MTADHIDVILNDCLLAAGQGLGHDKPVDLEVVAWWRQRYRRFFLHALQVLGNSYESDRLRVTAVGRYLGQRARHYAAASPTVSLRAAEQASRDVESGCRMSAERDGPGLYVPAPA